MPQHRPARNAWILAAIGGLTLFTAFAVLAVGAASPAGAKIRDRDGDGLSNRFERKRSHTNPRKADTDRDRLRDRAELRRWNTNPRRKDTDRDGLRDRAEVKRWHTNPRRKDTDRDGLSDRYEVKRSKTNPRRRDTDGDGVSDAVELMQGSNPLSRTPNPLSRTPNLTLPPPPGGSSAWPDASNTGVAGCPPLTPSGGLTVSQNGAVVQNLDVSGPVVVTGDNVTLRCVRVRAGALYPVKVDSAQNTTLERVEIDCQSFNGNNAGIVGADYTWRKVNVHHCEDGAKVGRNVLIEDSWCHDLNTAGGGPHYDCLQVMGCECWPVADNITIRHNTLHPRAVDATSAIIIKSDFGPIANVLVENNRMNYGAYTVYSRTGGHGNPTSVRFVGNRFGRGYKFGLKSFDGAVVWSGNVWDDSGATIP